MRRPKIPTKRPTRDHTFQVYRTVTGEWRWNIHSRNGRLTHASSEGYEHFRDAYNNLIVLVGGRIQFTEADWIGHTLLKRVKF